MRKSPIKHKVHTHKRSITDGSTTVQEYERGHGKHPETANIADPRVRRQQKSASGNSFVVNINYANQSSDRIPINASTYPEAIELAMLARVGIVPPSNVQVTKR